MKKEIKNLNCVLKHIRMSFKYLWHVFHNLCCINGWFKTLLGGGTRRSRRRQRRGRRELSSRGADCLSVIVEQPSAARQPRADVWDLAPGGRGRCFEGDELRCGSGGEVREFWPPPPLLLLTPLLASTMELENIVANTVLLKAREGKDGSGGTDPWYRMVNPLHPYPTLCLRKRFPPLPRNGCLTSSNSLTSTVGRIETGCQQKDAPLSSGTNRGTCCALTARASCSPMFDHTPAAFCA